MRIETTRVTTLEVPFSEPVLSGTHRWDRRRLAIVSLGADDGRQGLGEVAVPDPGGLAQPIAEGRLADLVGLDPDDEPGLAVLLDGLGLLPIVGRALRAAVDSAIVDLRAWAAGVSVAASMVEHPRDRVRLNSLIGIVPLETAVTTAQRSVGEGFECLKLKAGAEPVADLVARLAAVREAVGWRIELRVDFNGTLDPDAAAAVITALSPFHIAYVEQPIAASLGVGSLARLRRSVAVPLAADESVDGLASARELIDAESVDVLVVKPARVGGLAEARRIAELAEDHGVPVVVSTLFETGLGIAGALQLAASLPGDQAHGLATAGLLESDLLTQRLHVDGGRMALPGGPGLGIELDQDVIADLHVA